MNGNLITMAKSKSLTAKLAKMIEKINERKKPFNLISLLKSYLFHSSHEVTYGQLVKNILTSL